MALFKLHCLQSELKIGPHFVVVDGNFSSIEKYYTIETKFEIKICKFGKPTLQGPFLCFNMPK
jgi:hypothetical protein